MNDRALTYTNYLELPKLLSAQHPRSSPAEHDEMLFIIIHQVYELWFRQILHELAHLRALFEHAAAPQASHTLVRVLRIMKTLVGQIDILETMTPLEFQSFRSRLDSASGFESVQFRHIEFALGHKRPEVMAHFPHGSADHVALEERFRAPTVWDDFLAYLAGLGYAVPGDVLSRDVSAPPTPSPAVQAVLVEIYRRDPVNAALCERLVDLDEGLQEWRYRHVKMVQRTIGTKQGTGGSSGVAYLNTTLFTPVFPDLWEIRGEL